MKDILFTGSGVAIVTPFHAGAVNFPAFGRLIDRQIDGGTDAIIVCGTTGEASTMSYRERMRTIEFCVDHVDGRLPVIAGTGSNSTENALALSRDADIVIAAAGRPGLITADCLRPGQTVLDVGVHPGPDGTLCGDVAPEAAGLDLALTPVPGGVGSVTSAVLCKHTIQAAENTRL